MTNCNGATGARRFAGGNCPARTSRRPYSRRLRGRPGSSRGRLRRGGRRADPGRRRSIFRIRSALRFARRRCSGLWSWWPWGKCSVGSGERKVTVVTGRVAGRLARGWWGWGGEEGEGGSGAGRGSAGKRGVGGGTRGMPASRKQRGRVGGTRQVERELILRFVPARRNARSLDFVTAVASLRWGGQSERGIGSRDFVDQEGAKPQGKAGALLRSG